MTSFESKVALVTGAGRGMGREIALEFARHGADLVICDIGHDLPAIPYPLSTEADLKETKSLVEDLGRRCVAQLADVRDQAALDALVAAGVAEFGRIDVLSANAGVYDWSSDPLWETSDDAWNVQIGVCLEGVWRSAKAVAPQMISQGRGAAMVFTSSNVGAEGAKNSAPYVAAKHGVIGLMRTAALELGDKGIRVNAVLPSTTDTKINDHPAGWRTASGKPDGGREDYLDAVHQWNVLPNTTALPAQATAQAVVWLASDAASHITGVQLPIDAGHLVLPGFNPWPVRD